MWKADEEKVCGEKVAFFFLKGYAKYIGWGLWGRDGRGAGEKITVFM